MSLPPTSSFFLINPSPSSQYNGKIIIASLAMLCFVVLFILALHIYAKWFWRRSIRRQQALWRWRHSLDSQGHEPITLGLDKAIVDSLPTFIYKVSDFLNKEVMECAVCLSEFQDNERARLLPKCNHSFHTDCIDMWFLSHRTCPLCRTSAEPGDAPLSHPADTPEELQVSTILRQNGLPESTNVAAAAADGDGESLPSPGWTWRRSISDRFSQPPHAGVQFPTNVLFWGNNSHVSSHASALQAPPPQLEHGQRGGRSLPHMAIEIPRRSMHAPRCFSSGAAQAYLTSDQASQQQCKLPGSGLSVFKRLLSRERKVFPTTEQDMDACGHAVGASSGEMPSGP